MLGAAVGFGASELPHNLHPHIHIQASSTLQTSRNASRENLMSSLGERHTAPWATCSLLSAGTECFREAVPVFMSRLQSLKPAWLGEGAVTPSHESLDPLCPKWRLLPALWQPSEGSLAQFTGLTATAGPWVSLQLRKLRPWRENESSTVYKMELG